MKIFSLAQLRALELTTTELGQNEEERKIVVTEAEQLEWFYTPLVYAGILNDEETVLTSVTYSLMPNIDRWKSNLLWNPRRWMRSSFWIWRMS